MVRKPRRKRRQTLLLKLARWNRDRRPGWEDDHRKEPHQRRAGDGPLLPPWYSSAPLQNAINLRDPSLYLNRELSWLEFNRRAFDEAIDVRRPLLEP